MKPRSVFALVGLFGFTSPVNAEWMYLFHNTGTESGLARWNLGVPGSQPEILVTHAQLDSLGYQGGPYPPIVVDSVIGKFYFVASLTSSQGPTTLFRANLDGTDLEPFHTTNWAYQNYDIAIYRPPGNVPAVSTWWLLILAILVATAGTVIARTMRRQQV